KAKANIVDTFTGTSAELLKLVTPADDWRAPKGWPSNARAVTRLLHQQGPVMRKAGWTVADDSGANHSGVTQWSLTPPREGCISSPPTPRDPRETTSAGIAGIAGHEYEPSHDDQFFDAEEYDEPDAYEVAP